VNIGQKTGVFSKNSETSDMTSERLGEMFECDFADLCAEKFPLLLMVGRGRVEGLAFADPGARTPIGMSGNYQLLGYLTTLSK
jgi:hypothetical protein